MAEAMNSDRLEHRRSLRIDENVPVRWKFESTSLKGEGRIKNLNAYGMCLETKESSITQGNGSQFVIDKFLKDVDIPEPILGRIVWSQKLNGRGNTLCGVEFVNPQENVVSKIRERIQKRIVSLTASRKFKSLLYPLIFVAMVVFGSYTIHEYTLLSEQWQFTHTQQMKLSASQTVLYRQVLAQLADARQNLTEAQELMAQTQQEKDRLQAALSNLQTQSGNQTTELSLIRDRNEQLKEELAQINSRLQNYEREISSLEDGKALIGTYQQKIKSVKLAMRDIKRQAYEMKVAALKELDRIKLMQGNNGFLIKDGQIKMPGSFKAQDKRQIEIRVEMVK